MNEEDRFKFIDDLTILEIVNPITIGLSSFNVRGQVPTDIPDHNQYIPPQNIKSQEWLNTINEWIENQKMLVNEKKTKAMIFNYTKNYQFTTRLTINYKDIDVNDSTAIRYYHSK